MSEENEKDFQESIETETKVVLEQIRKNRAERWRRGMTAGGLTALGIGLSLTFAGLFFLPLIIPGIIVTLLGVASVGLGELIFGNTPPEEAPSLKVHTDDQSYPPVPERETSYAVTPEKTETAREDLTILSAPELVDKFESMKIAFGKKVNEEGRQFGLNDQNFIQHNKLSLQSHINSEALKAKEDAFSKDTDTSNTAKGILIAEIEKMQSTFGEVEARLDAKTSYTDAPKPM